MIAWQSSSVRQILLILAFLVILGLLSPYFGIALFFSSPIPKPHDNRWERNLQSQRSNLPNSKSSNSIGEKTRLELTEPDNQSGKEQSFESLLQVEELLKPQGQ